MPSTWQSNDNFIFTLQSEFAALNALTAQVNTLQADVDGLTTTVNNGGILATTAHQGSVPMLAATGEAALYLRGDNTWVTLPTMGPPGPIGPPGMTWQGPWVSTTAYAVHDGTQYQGSSYIAIAANTNSAPPSANWNLLAQQGAVGLTGPAGSTGPAGPTGPAGVQGLPGPQGAQGAVGSVGPAGPQGTVGPAGPTGAAGAAATVAAGTTTTLAPGTNAAVTNVGSNSAAIFNFAIPQGAPGTPGATGAQGATGNTGATGPAGPNGATGATGPVGPQGPQGPVGQGLTPKGTVPTSSALPPTGNTTGDMWIAADTGHGWMWSGTAWVDIGPMQGPAGPQGPAGAAYTNTTAGFTVPTVGSSVTVNMANTSWATVGEFVYVTGAAGAGVAGALKITALTPTSMTLLNAQAGAGGGGIPEAPTDGSIYGRRGSDASWQTVGAGSSGTVTSITAGTGLTGGAITTSGTIALASPVAVANGGRGSTTAPTAGQIDIAQSATVISPVTLSGDAAITSAGVITVSKTGGTTFSALATAAIPLSIANGGTAATTAAAALTSLGALPLTGGTLTGPGNLDVKGSFTADGSATFNSGATVSFGLQVPNYITVNGATTLNGTSTAPTVATADNSTNIATTAFVKNQSYAPLASPTFTGTPAAPTAAAGTSTTQLATTAFVGTALTPPTISWLAGVNPASGTIILANRAMTIVSITGIVEIANGAAATVSVVKAASGVLLSAGTVVHSGSFNANGTAGAYQPLTLTVTTLAAGERLGLTTTGTFSASVASVNVVLQ